MKAPTYFNYAALDTAQIYSGITDRHGYKRLDLLSILVGHKSIICVSEGKNSAYLLSGLKRGRVITRYFSILEVDSHPRIWARPSQTCLNPSQKLHWQQVMKVSTVQVIGIGKKGRGDDAVGICLARLLRERLPPEVEVLEEEGEALRLMEDWKRRELVILIDAVEAGYDLGTLHRFQFPGDDIPTNLFRFSAHAFGVAQAIELGRVLGKLPKKLVLYGIEGKCFEANKALSREVEKALPNALSRICKEITQLIPSGD